MLSPIVVSAAILATLVVVPATARADPARGAAFASTTDSDASPSRRWYGWQTLVVDGAALGLGVSGLRLAGEHTALGVSLGGAGAVGYALVAPAIHWANERPRVALLSLAIRAGLPLVSGGLLVAADAGRCVASGEPEHERFCDRMDEALLVAMTLSAVVASGFDAAVLGWAPRREAPRRMALAPLVSVDGRGGAFAGLGGAF